MKRRWLVVSLISLLGVETAGWSQAPKPITKAGLIKALQIGGLSSKELVQQISVRGVAFPLTPDVEAELKAAGASSDVVEAARAHSPRAGAPPNPPVRNPSAPPPDSPMPRTTLPQSPNIPTKPGVYVKKSGQWMELLTEGVNWKRGPKLKKFTIGMGKNEMVGSIPGGASPNHLKNPVTFLICTPASVGATDYQLLLIADRKGIREIKVGGDTRNSVPFTARKLTDQNYVVEFSQGAGEYGFLPPGGNAADASSLAIQLYTFRVE